MRWPKLLAQHIEHASPTAADDGLYERPLNRVYQEREPELRAAKSARNKKLARSQQSDLSQGYNLTSGQNRMARPR